MVQRKECAATGGDDDNGGGHQTGPATWRTTVEQVGQLRVRAESAPPGFAPAHQRVMDAVGHEYSIPNAASRACRAAERVDFTVPLAHPMTAATSSTGKPTK